MHVSVCLSNIKHQRKMRTLDLWTAPTKMGGGQTNVAW